jgi:FkbM family methyltransferase
VVRAARFVLNRARLDVVNDPSANGEYALQRWVLAGTPPGEMFTALDVGANIGAWSRRLLTNSGRTPVRLHAFEPAADTYALLAANLPGPAEVNRLAVSDECRPATLYVAGPAAGTNSLHAARSGLAAEAIHTVTIDQYLAEHGIERVDLLKVDTEGHDFAVLRGARASFAAGAIGVVQFEYNHRWVFARQYLKDVFDLLAPLGYRIGKLTPGGVEFYPDWDPELETFIEGNYVACTAAKARRLPAVPWWKSTAAPSARAQAAPEPSLS